MYRIGRIGKNTKISIMSMSSEMLNFVPEHLPVLESEINAIYDFISNSKSMFILTGAGISTESGIPDYRSEKVGLYARINHKPIQYQQFLKFSEVRQRYWARNFVGWERFSASEPNAVHDSIRNLELSHQKVSVVVTQNVDGLHSKAGSQNVIELHGTAYRVICLNCKHSYDRHYIQDILKELNPNMIVSSSMIRPDGDVDIPQEKIWAFKPPFCTKCEGILKPDIIFFGDNVPKDRVKQVEEYVSKSDSILVLGSSLSVYSGYRIILQATEKSKRIAIINIGPTRADKHASLKISARCGDVLPRLI